MKATLSGITETENQNDDNNQALVPAQTAAVGDSFFSNADIEGDFDRSDFKIPKLNLVQSVGPLTEHFQPGVFVYNKETELGNRPIDITLLKLRKYFIEDVPYGSGLIPDIVAHEKEFRTKGGFLTRERKAMGERAKDQKFYKPTLDATILIKGRPDVDVAFPFEFEGTPYALAVWTLQSVAYGETGTKFITAAAYTLRTGLAQGAWSVTPTRKKVGSNWIWLPIARQTGKNSTEFVAWAKSLGAGGNDQ